VSWIDAIRHRLRAVIGHRRLTREMDDEIRFHLELGAMHDARGLESDEAAWAARRRFGNPASIADERRDAAGLATLDRVRQDARQIVRQIRRAPAVPVAVILTLALGLGAASTMFAIIDRVMLRAPQGIRDPERLVQIRPEYRRAGGESVRRSSLSYPSYVEFRAMTDVFASVTAVNGPYDMPVDRGIEASRASGSIVADNYFQTLGVRPARGRFFAIEETNERAGAAVAVLGFGYWQRRYGGAPDVVGRTLLVNNVPYTVIGVAPRGFSGHDLSATDFWLPIAVAWARRSMSYDWASDRGISYLRVIARLRPEVSRSQALARAAVGWTAWNIRPLRAPAPGSPAVRAPRPYFTSLVPAESEARPEHRVAWLLGAVSLLLLLIVCANVANLLLVRALARRRDVAIRLALGVRRRRLVRAFVAEALVLAFAGGAAALVVTHWGVPVVRSVLFAGTPTGEWRLDVRVVGFTLLVAIVAGALAGIVPAIQASRPSLLAAVREGAREGFMHRSRTRTILIVVQGALSVALLAGTGLFVRSLERIGAQHLGLDLDRVLIAVFRGDQYDDVTLRRLYDEMRERASGLPGVESASLSIGAPLTGQYAFPLRLSGHDSLPGMRRGYAPFLFAVTADYFRTMGTRLIAGRPFQPADEHGPRLAIVGAEMARVFWPDGNALGQCFAIEEGVVDPCTRVIGIVEDARREALLETAPQFQYYVPLDQVPGHARRDLALLVRARNPAATKAVLARTLQAVRADLPFVSVRSLEDVVAPELRPWRLGASMFGLFGALALLVAAVGLYSVMQFSVSQRLHELGVRIALGARRGHILGLVTRQALAMAGLATAAGVVLVLLLGGFVGPLLFHTSPRDPVVLVSVTVVLLLAALLAALPPAWRAARTDPVRTLKAD
jgi:putative ABC transport system permease protein